MKKQKATIKAIIGFENVYDVIRLENGLGAL